MESFSNSPEEVQCLLTILRYMASECEDESVVIEESLRESYLDYLDTICDLVIQEVFNVWAENVLNNAGD